jgi:hypothetical protein
MPWKRSPKWCRKPSAAAGLPPMARPRKRRTLEKLGMEPSGVHTTSTGLFFRDDQAFRAVAPPTYGPTGPYDSDRSIHQTHAHSRELRALLRFLTTTTIGYCTVLYCTLLSVQTSEYQYAETCYNREQIV